MHLVLLRGLAREAAHWLDFPERLQHVLGNNCQLHLIDLPGCGQYCDQPALKTVATMTDHVRSKISMTLGTANSESIYVIGISMGGMIAVDWAQRFPQEIHGLVLINSSAGNQPFWWRLRPGAWVTVISALLSSCSAREAKVLKIVSNNTADYAQHLNQWLSIQQQRPITRTTILTMLRAAAQFHPEPTCAVKGLVLTSERDRMVSVRASETIAEQFAWSIARHSSAGHDLPMDDPDWTANQIAHWLKTQT